MAEAYVNPYTLALLQHPLEETLPVQTPVSAQTAQMLSPSTGSVLAPALQYVVGRNQRAAEQEQFRFNREQTKNKLTQQKAKTQSLLNWVDNAYKNQGSAQASYLRERYGDNPAVVKDLVQQGALNPLEGFSEWSRGYARTEKSKRALRGLFDQYKNSPIFTMSGADRLNFDQLAETEDGRILLKDKLNQMRNLQKTLIEKQGKNGIAYKMGDKYIRFKTNGDIVEMKKVPDPRRVVDLAEFDVGRTGTEMDFDSNIDTAAKQMFSPALWSANRDSEQVQQIIKHALDKYAVQEGIEPTPEQMQQAMTKAYNIVKASKEPLSAEQIAAKAFPSKTAVKETVTGEELVTVPTPPEGFVFSLNGEGHVPIKSQEGIAVAKAYALHNGIPERQVLTALTNPITATHIAQQIAQWQMEQHPSLTRSVTRGAVETGKEALSKHYPTKLIGDILNAVEAATTGGTGPLNQ